MSIHVYAHDPRLTHNIASHVRFLGWTAGWLLTHSFVSTNALHWGWVYGLGRAYDLGILMAPLL